MPRLCSLSAGLLISGLMPSFVKPCPTAALLGQNALIIIPKIIPIVRVSPDMLIFQCAYNCLKSSKVQSVTAKNAISNLIEFYRSRYVTGI